MTNAVKKSPSIEDLEVKLANSKVTKIRVDILQNIKNGYASDISSKYDPLLSEQSQITDKYKVPDQKADVEKIVKVIKATVGDKYELVYEVVYKIADGNNLQFNLRPIYDKVPALASAKKQHDKLHSEKLAAQKKLSEWQRNQLYNIANGKDFEVFEVK